MELKEGRWLVEWESNEAYDAELAKLPDVESYEPPDDFTGSAVMTKKQVLPFLKKIEKDIMGDSVEVTGPYYWGADEDGNNRLLYEAVYRLDFETWTLYRRD